MSVNVSANKIRRKLTAVNGSPLRARQDGVEYLQQSSLRCIEDEPTGLSWTIAAPGLRLDLLIIHHLLHEAPVRLLSAH